MILSIKLFTTGVDKLVGTAGADVVGAKVSTIGSETTLQGTDTLDGLAGADTLSVDLAANFAGFTTGSVKNVETVFLKNSTDVARTFDATGIVGATTYTVDSSGKGTGATLSGLDTLGSLKLSNQDGGAVVVQYKAGVLSTTVNNVLNVSLEAVKGSSGLTVNNIQDMKIASTGANAIRLDTSTELKSITATGDSTLGLRARVASLETVDASGVTGAVTGDFRTATLKSLKTGAGDDTLTVTALSSLTTIDGGAGKNTVILDGFGAGSFRPDMKNIQTIEVSNSTGAIALNLVDATALTAVAYNQLAGNALTLQSYGTGAFSVSSKGAQAASTITALGTGPLTFSTGTSPSATSVTNDGVATILTTSAGSLVVDVAARTNMSGAITANSATSVSIDAKGGFTSTIAAGLARTLDIKASADAPINITTAFAAVDTLTVNSKANVALSDFVTLNNGTFVGDGAASQTLTLGTLGSATHTGALTVKTTGFGGGLTIGTVNSRAATVLDFAKVGGNVATGAIGTAANTSGSVTVLGSKVGTNTFAAINAGQSKTITVDVAGSLGNVTLAAMTVANGSAALIAGLGVLAVPSGSITVDVSGTLGNAVLAGTLTAGTVTLKADGVTGGVGAAGTAVGTVVGPAIAANTAVITGNATGINTFATVTANNVTFKGGSAVDTLTITGRQLNTTVGSNLEHTFNIDTGAGDDIVTFTASVNPIITLKGTVALGAGALDQLLLNAVDGNTTFNASGLAVTGINDTVFSVATGIAATAAEITTALAAAKASTTLRGFVEIDAAAATGATTIAGVSNVANIIRGGVGANTITGGNAADIIIGGNGIDTLTGGAGADIFVLQGILLSANRDIITDFTSGTDDLRVLAADTTMDTAIAATAITGTSTTAAGVGGGAYTLAGVNTTAGGATVITSANTDVIRLNVTAAGPNSGDLSLTTADGLNGTELLKALTDATAADTHTDIVGVNGSVGFIQATQGGITYLYHYVTGGDTAISAGDINLIGTFNGLAAGLVAGDFILA